MLALVVVAGYVVMLLAIGDLRADERGARRAQRVAVAANSLERLLLDVAAAAPSPQGELPGRAQALLSLVRNDPRSASRARAIVRAERAYIGDVAAGRVQPGSAAKGRVDAIRVQFDRLLAPQQRAEAGATARAESAARRASAAAAVGLGGSLALIVLYVAYLRRAIVRPVRRAAAMADRMAGGDLAVRLPEDDVGEVGALERAFNVMGGSLERNRDELRASRARIVATADETRRRIERDLHDGAQQRLVALALELRATQAGVPGELSQLAAELDDVAGGLTEAMEELREIARGIHPAILAEGGLGPALRTVARRSPVPVHLDVRVPGRLPQPLEVGAYYVVSEALTNAAKHARASAVTVEVDAADGALRVDVRDDGVGGARLGVGSGLMGLKDRVEALGGRITVESPPGDGTALHVELPLRS